MGRAALVHMACLTWTSLKAPLTRSHQTPLEQEFHYRPEHQIRLIGILQRREHYFVGKRTEY